ncbi:MAG: NUDIX hydrolase [candidate division NC10 bacterium]|nr:NUDIX hydrolase [candidate division NC10 bacterium]
MASRSPSVKARTKVKHQVSSGGVIVREKEGTFEVALIGLRGGSVWGLPKGLVEAGEDPQATALREVREETGLVGRPLGKLGEIEYWFFDKEEGARIHKTVHFYLLAYVEGSPEDHDFEVEEVRWYPIEEALRLMAYRNEREMVERALQKLGGEPLGKET